MNSVLYTTWSNATTYTASEAQNFFTIGNLLSGKTCYNPGILQNPF